MIYIHGYPQVLNSNKTKKDAQKYAQVFFILYYHIQPHLQPLP